MADIRDQTVRATQYRTARARMKEQMKAGTLDAAVLIRGDDPLWEPIVKRSRIGDMLRAVKGFGPATVQDFLEAEELSGETRLQAMTYERRAAIAKFVAAARDGDLGEL